MRVTRSFSLDIESLEKIQKMAKHMNLTVSRVVELSVMHMYREKKKEMEEEEI